MFFEQPLRKDLTKTEFNSTHLEGILESSALRTCLFTNFRCETVSYGVI